MKIELAKKEIIHFIGIGGIGMSGLSLIMKGKGFKVQGSDIIVNKNIERLKKEKIKIFVGHKNSNLKNVTIVVVSSAIKKDNHQFENAKFYRDIDCCWIIDQNYFDEKIDDLLKDILNNKSNYFKKKENLKKLNYQNTWNNVNQKILKSINEN